jgi:glycosyltransferase involved in cell wall biosynthesis
MKIVYDHQIFSRQKYGGISRYFFEISNRIPAIDGDSVEIFSPFYVNHYGDRSSHGFRAFKFPGSSMVLGAANTVAGKLSVRWQNDIAIFHETYYSRFGYAPAKAKRIITVYDMIHELFPESFSKADMTRHIKRRAILRADHVICISESTRNDLVRLTDIPVEKTSVVHLGHSLTEAHVSPPPVPYSQRPYLLYVGNRGGYKNFNSLMLAVGNSKILRNEFSVICFGGGEFTRDELSEMRRHDLNLDDIKHVEGDDAVLAGLYSSAIALVYPSLYEGFGIPPLEAMAYGCPVICTDTSSLPEVVGEAAELFDPRDTDCLRASIERVASSQEVRKGLIARGYERIMGFSWDRCARATLAQYKRVLES